MARSVFTYGSLMFEPVWARVVTGRYRSVPAVLHGFRRQRVRGATYPSLMRCAGAAVEGLLYLDVTDDDIAALDRFEGAGYRRIAVGVQTRVEGRAGDAAGGRLAADTYLFVAEEKMEPGEWDAERFGRELIGEFLREHAPEAAKREAAWKSSA